MIRVDRSREFVWHCCTNPPAPIACEGFREELARLAKRFWQAPTVRLLNPAEVAYYCAYGVWRGRPRLDPQPR